MINKKAKGTKKCIVKTEITFKNYADALFNDEVIIRSQQRFRSGHLKVYTEEVNKIALSSNDNKRIETFDKVTTYPYGANAFMICENEMKNELQIKKMLNNKSQEVMNKPVISINELQSLKNESHAIRDRSKVLRNEAHVLKKESLLVRNELHEIRNEAQVLKNESQVLRSETLIPENDTLLTKNESQVLRNKSRVLKNEAQSLRKESLLVRNELDETLNEARELRIGSEVLRLKSKALRNVPFKPDYETCMPLIEGGITFDDFEDDSDMQSLFEGLGTDTRPNDEEYVIDDNKERHTHI